MSQSVRDTPGSRKVGNNDTFVQCLPEQSLTFKQRNHTYIHRSDKQAVVEALAKAPSSADDTTIYDTYFYLVQMVSTRFSRQGLTFRSIHRSHLQV